MNTSGENIFSMHWYIFVLHYFIQTVHSFNFIGDIGWNVANLDSLWATSTDFVCKFDARIVSSFEFYKQSFTNKNNQPALGSSFCDFANLSTFCPQSGFCIFLE